MPVRGGKESLQDYVGRCIPIRKKEHPELPHKAVIASCYNMGRTHWKPKKKTKYKGKYPKDVL